MWRERLCVRVCVCVCVCVRARAFVHVLLIFMMAPHVRRSTRQSRR